MIHYPIHRTVKIDQETLDGLIAMSFREKLAVGTLMRRIIEDWLVQRLEER